jgi:alpha-maltose-1-phosphate synthase
MKVVLSTIGKFHTFDLARQLHTRGVLAGIFSGYPRFKLRNESLPRSLVHTFPWVHAPYMRMRHRERLGRRIVQDWEYLDRITLDAWVARRLPECDVFVGLSGSALKSGRQAKARGARYVCDRGSSHIRVQDQLLSEEHERWGLPYEGIDPRVIDREEAEYAEADCITVPSTFARHSFLSQGIEPAKVKLLPYGVDLSMFSPTAKPASDRFDVLFVGGMSLRKGLPYLLDAYRQLQHPAKSISFAGAASAELIELMRRQGRWPSDARLLGHVPQDQLKHLMSRSHVLVLASVEEGLALVQAQAMACGCVVVGTTNTGAEDLFTNGHEGYVLPIRDADAMARRLQQLADAPELREAMSLQALERVRGMGGWQEYGNEAVASYLEAIQCRR